MLPGASAIAFLLATASIVTTVNPVGINNETASKTTTDGSTATASFTFRTDRTVKDQDGLNIDAAWISAGYAVGDYSIRVTVNSGSTPTGTVGSWLALSSNRTWSLSQTSGASGIKTCSLKVEIKENATGTILDTATYTLNADSQTSAVTTYTPAAGSYSYSDFYTVEAGISASSSVPWTWSAVGMTGLACNLASGASGTAILFTLTASGSSDHHSVVTVNSGGKTWTLTLDAYADSGGTNCVVVDTPILMSDPVNDGVIEVAAGSIQEGDEVYTQHPDTMEWGAFPVSAIKIVDDVTVYAIEVNGKTIRATKGHRFFVDGDWHTIEELGGKLDGRGSVVKLTVDDAHTYMSAGQLSHNVKP